MSSNYSISLLLASKNSESLPENIAGWRP